MSKDTGTILIYVVIIALVAIIPMLLDVVMAYRATVTARRKLIDKCSADKLTEGELKELLKEIRRGPPGIPGLARATMALTVIVILGISVVHVLVNKTSTEDSQLVSNLLSLLGGLLAAITGFYFGGKAGEKKTEEEEEKPK